MTALALMSESTFADQFDHRRLSKLRSLITLTEPFHVDDLDLLPTDQLGDVEVLLTGWGTPHLDQRQLDRMPRLAAVLHCAGSVRSLVSESVWRRGIQVSSAAEVNAIP